MTEELLVQTPKQFVRPLYAFSPKQALPLQKHTKKHGSNPKKSVDHPPVAEMISAAIENINTKNGTSVVAIKKYLAERYKVNVEKLAPFIKKSLARGVEKKIFIQITGKGYSGSFKFAEPFTKKKSVKPHVTASDVIKGKTKIAKKKKKSVAKVNRPVSKQSSRASSRLSAEKKPSLAQVHTEDKRLV